MDQKNPEITIPGDDGEGPASQGQDEAADQDQVGPEDDV